MASQQNKWKKGKKKSPQKKKKKPRERHKSVTCDLKTANTINYFKKEDKGTFVFDGLPLRTPERM